MHRRSFLKGLAGAVASLSIAARLTIGETMAPQEVRPALEPPTPDRFRGEAGLPPNHYLARDAQISFRDLETGEMIKIKPFDPDSEWWTVGPIGEPLASFGNSSRLSVLHEEIMVLDEPSE